MKLYDLIKILDGSPYKVYATYTCRYIFCNQDNAYIRNKYYNFEVVNCYPNVSFDTLNDKYTPYMEIFIANPK